VSPPPFRLDVVTPESPLLSEDVESLVAPGEDGYLGVLAHHAPLVTALGPGDLKITRPGGEEVHYSITGGFMEVSAAATVVLADRIEPEAGK
jgi:F-type H+-transporting ATPase subunit epsilon